MASVRELHNEAIHLANMATRSLQFDPEAQVATLFRQAFELESQAASLVPNEPSSEPTRSILYQSAASLALQCGEFKIARQLVAQGLTGYPPPKIEHQLIRLFDQIKLEENFDNVDLDMAIQGNSAGNRSALSSDAIILAPTALNQDQKVQERHSIEVRGILNFADDTKSNLSKVGLTDESGKLYFINVTGGIDELVRSNWKQAVSVSGTTADGQTIYPYDIQSIN